MRERACHMWIISICIMAHGQCFVSEPCVPAVSQLEVDLVASRTVSGSDCRTLHRTRNQPRTCRAYTSRLVTCVVLPSTGVMMWVVTHCQATAIGGGLLHHATSEPGSLLGQGIVAACSTDAPSAFGPVGKPGGDRGWGGVSSWLLTRPAHRHFDRN